MEYFTRFNSVIKQVFGWNNPSQEEENEGDTRFGHRLKKSLRSIPSMDEFLIRLGDIYIKMRKYESAMNCFREAALVNPDNTMALNRLVVIPFHFLEKKKPSGRSLKINFADKASLMALALNDTFRQTFIGGQIIQK